MTQNAVRGGVIRLPWKKIATPTQQQDAQQSRGSIAPDVQPLAITGIVPFTFGYQNLTASLTAAKLYRVIPGAAATFAQQGVPMPNPGSVVAILLRATEAITAGSAMFVPYVEQTARSDAQLVWAASNRKTASFLPGLATFNADEELDVRVTTPAGFTPITTDVEVIVLVTFEAV